jgi:hypothetical protein
MRLAGPVASDEDVHGRRELHPSLLEDGEAEDVSALDFHAQRPRVDVAANVSRFSPGESTLPPAVAATPHCCQRHGYRQTWRINLRDAHSSILISHLGIDDALTVDGSQPAI